MKRLENSNPKFRERFIKHSIDYFDSVLPEAEHRIKDSVMTLDEYIPHRRENGGVKPCFDLFEYCFDIDLPDEVFEDEAFIRVCDAAIDCVGWSNVRRKDPTHFDISTDAFSSGCLLVRSGAIPWTRGEQRPHDLDAH